MARTPFIVVPVLLLVAFHVVPGGSLRAQVPATAGHEHLSEVACVDVPPGEKRPEFGCFNVGTVTGLHFSQASVYWHLRAFPSRQAAEAAKSATGIVVEEDGRAWLSEFGARNSAPRAGEAIAVVGPLEPAPGCIRIRAPRAGTSWPESSVWRLRLALTGLGPEEPWPCERIRQWS
jgi:hypothetical protein